MPCPECGSKARHRRLCSRWRPDRRQRRGLLEAARIWYDTFGADRLVITPTGRGLFRFLLEEVERLQLERDAATAEARAGGNYASQLRK